LNSLVSITSSLSSTINDIKKRQRREGSPDDDGFVRLQVIGTCAYHPTRSSGGRQLKQSRLWLGCEKSARNETKRD
jgi:hypothetical protein